MAYTVEASFSDFYEGINLPGDHRETANARRDRIVDLLKKDFEILEAFGTGSIPKFTALKGRADLDIMVALHFSKHIKDKAPSTVLQNVRDSLSDYRTDVRKNGQAVTLYYETWPNVDIVPVSRSVNDAKQVTHYNVSNSKTETWMPSRPKSHATAIAAKASECGQNFRQIIKMIKWWNIAHSEYLTSYHIEALALNVLHGNLDDTTWHVHKFFEDARPLLEKPLWHQVAYADDYLSYLDRDEVLRRVDTAIQTSLSAWHSTYGASNHHKTAIGLWRQIFGEKFPAYG
jgi:Second Messenger Oligonucleotide or Dinucleotide Synthetase domain